MLTFITFVSAFLAMEFMAWFTHKYLMHGFLWFLHQDHHVQDSSFFQKNDSFFLIFALPSWLCIMFGLMNNNIILASIGYGIALYGMTYFFVHDMYIHERFFKTKHWKIPVLLAMRKAHNLHHGVVEKEHGEYFGLLFSPLKFLFKNKTKN